MHLTFRLHTYSKQILYYILQSLVFGAFSGLVPKREPHAPPSCQKGSVALLSVTRMEFLVTTAHK